ncbi:MAG: hypothetical protein EU533_00035 [Promethearchaeota archaeon]|nr:MAG: hypothetical protein EU533_00035 [Candidatus Lokiarchaeota archaeon]
MSVNNIHNRLEKLINSLSVKEGREKYLRNQTNYLKKKLRATSHQKFEDAQNNLEKISNSLEVLTFWYSGSFDRGVYINNGFDIDIYPIYKPMNRSKFEKKFGIKSLTGEILFGILYYDLREINKINPKLVILKEPPYNHSIPTRIDFEEQTVDFDCIPAIELPDGILIAPNGTDSVKKVNLLLEEKGLLKVNKRHNGNATKLIFLLKYWNWNWNYPVKSYIIQRLVEEIFLKESMKSWDKAIKTFFKKSIIIFKKYLRDEIVLKDRVYTHKSILDDYSEEKVYYFFENLKEGYAYAVNDDWYALFGNF